MVIAGIDAVYGQYKIVDPLLEDINNTSSVQRLKRICQGGVPREFDPYPDFSRYDHSLGVVLLLQQVGASRAEQAAGFVHDVNHTAFSHLVDWVLGSSRIENLQDKSHASFVMASELPYVLARHGFSVDDVIRHERHTLLEQEIPGLCADRVDYSLRIFTWYAPEVVPLVRQNICAYEGKLVMRTKESAQRFAHAFLGCQRDYLGGVDHAIRYGLLKDIFRQALDERIISADDFMTDDTTVMAKLQQSAGARQGFARLSRLRYALSDEKNHDLHLFKKFRYIDPAYLETGGVRVLSATDEDFRKEAEAARLANGRGMYVRLLS